MYEKIRTLDIVYRCCLLVNVGTSTNSNLIPGDCTLNSATAVQLTS